MPARRRYLAAALLALGAAGCAGAEGADCAVDSDCDESQDLGCWQGTCQKLSPPDGHLAFEVIPRATGGLGPEAFAPDAADGAELTLCPPERVSGTIELPADFPVDVIAVATTPIPGLERTLTTVLPAEPGATGARSFSIALPPARWRIRFTSRDGASPPLATAVQVPGCTPVPVRDVSPAGRYTRELPLRFGPGPLGHCGARVQAFDPLTGEPRSAEVVSRGDGDSCPDRVLSVLVDDVDETVDLVLRVRPAPGFTAVASQELRFRSHPGADGLCPLDLDPPCPAAASIDLLPPDGDEPTRLEAVTVEVEGADGLPVAAGGVDRVEALGLLDGAPSICPDPLEPTRCGWGQGTVPATFGAREEGPGPSVSLPLLLPGRYGFTVVPDPATGLAITAFPERAIDPAAPLRLRLARKVVAAGTVTFEGQPLRAQIRAEPLGHAGRPATTETGLDGRYQLALDPGPYRLEVRPSDPYRSVPWANRELATGSTGGTFDVAVPPRARVQGRARTADGPVAGAVVRVFRCDRACGDEGATALPVGEAITGADGSFALLVPGT